jgi:hypothetical protein
MAAMRPLHAHRRAMRPSAAGRDGGQRRRHRTHTSLLKHAHDLLSDRAGGTCDRAAVSRAAQDGGSDAAVHKGRAGERGGDRRRRRAAFGRLAARGVRSPAIPTLSGVPAGRDTAMFSAAACWRELRSGAGLAIGATTRPSTAERAPASAAGLAARRVAGATGAKAVADAASATTARSDLASIVQTARGNKSPGRCQAQESIGRKGFYSFTFPGFEPRIFVMSTRCSLKTSWGPR